MANVIIKTTIITSIVQNSAPRLGPVPPRVTATPSAIPASTKTAVMLATVATEIQPRYTLNGTWTAIFSQRETFAPPISSLR